MNEWRSIIAHIYSVASIITKFTPKHPHSPIYSNRRRSLSCWNHRHSSRIAFVNLLIYRSPCTHALLIEQSVNSLFRYMPPEFNSFQKRVDVAKSFLLAHRNISLSFLGVVLRGLPDRGRSSTIPVSYKRCIRRSIG